MLLFELLVGLLFVGALLTVAANRLRMPYPALLAILGAAPAFIPTGFEFALDPQLALVLFVAPTLMDAAYDASPRDLRKAWLPVSGLVLVAVALTIAAVAFVARALVPDMPWPVAVVLGAIVAPPDASASTAVMRAIRPPHRVMVVLTGESLLNDASALLIYRVGLTMAAGLVVSVWSAFWLLALSCVGGAVAGMVLARLYVALLRPIRDVAVSVTLQFMATFVVWLVSTRIGLSPVITTFAYGLTLAQASPRQFDVVTRRVSFAVWRVAVFVLNALAFILIGLQLRGVVDRAEGHLLQTAAFAGAILLTVVVVRGAWVMGFTCFLRALPSTLQIFRPKLGASAVIAWSGMRGIVTLAAALALPESLAGGTAFPERDLLVASAFTVVLGTLVLQGLSLAPLLKALRVEDDGIVSKEIALAHSEIFQASEAALRQMPGPHSTALLQYYRSGARSAAGKEAAIKALAAQRACLFELRRAQKIGDEAYQDVQEDLDWAEGSAARSTGEALR